MKKNLVPGQRPPVDSGGVERIERIIAMIVAAVVVAAVVVAGVIEGVCR